MSEWQSAGATVDDASKALKSMQDGIKAYEDFTKGADTALKGASGLLDAASALGMAAGAFGVVGAGFAVVTDIVNGFKPDPVLRAIQTLQSQMSNMEEKLSNEIGQLKGAIQQELAGTQLQEVQITLDTYAQLLDGLAKAVEKGENPYAESGPGETFTDQLLETNSIKFVELYKEIAGFALNSRNTPFITGFMDSLYRNTYGDPSQVADCCAYLQMLLSQCVQIYTSCALAHRWNNNGKKPLDQTAINGVMSTVNTYFYEKGPDCIPMGDVNAKINDYVTRCETELQDNVRRKIDANLPNIDSVKSTEDCQKASKYLLGLCKQWPNAAFFVAVYEDISGNHRTYIPSVLN